MRLAGFRIRNIKSIVDSGWCHIGDKDNLTVFAGQNEAGKTAILEGLNFFRNGASEEFIDLSTRSDQTYPYVECEFKLEDGDFQGDEDVMRIIGKLGTVRLFRGDTVKLSYDAIHLESQTLETIDIEINKIIKREEEEKARIETEHQKAGTPPPEPQTQEAPTSPDGLRELVVQHFRNHLPTFILYSSFENHLPGNIKVSDLETSQAVKDFQTVYKFKFTDIIGLKHLEYKNKILEINKRATADFNDYWSQKLSNIADAQDQYQYEIEFQPNDTTPEAGKIFFSIHRNNSPPLYIGQKSKGFQWFSSFYLRLRALSEESNGTNKIILLIDEPGQGLHETAQEDVKKVLEELGKKGMQILYSTHNPYLIGIDDSQILRIRLVFQLPEEGTKINNITQHSNTKGSMDALSPIVTAMGLKSITQILERTVPGVALEGVTDHYYLSAMKKILGITENYAFIPSVGVPNIRHLISILIGWGGSYKAIFDGDNEGKRVYEELKKYLYPNDENDAEFKKHIYMLENAEGIEDLFTPEDFDNFIIGSTRTDATDKNSALAKKTKRKELIARLFLEKVDKAETSLALSSATKENFRKVFNWLRGTPPVTTTVSIPKLIEKTKQAHPPKVHAS